MKEKLNKLIKEIKEKPEKEKDKKKLIKKIKDIKNKLSRNGLRLLSMELDLEKEKWYCMTCEIKQPIKYPHLVEHRNARKIYMATCSVCDNELLKKRG